MLSWDYHALYFNVSFILQKMNALISILIPIYKVEKYIERCLHSVLGQTYDNIEYIFIDDCSPDKSMRILEEVVKQYPDKRNFVKVISHTENKGIAQTRNELLGIAKGEYCIFIDSDDFIELNTMEILYNKARETDAEIIRYNYYENYGEGKYIVVKNEEAQNREQLLKIAISSLSGVDSMWKLFVKRSLYVDYCLSFENGINACEDYIMSVKLFYFSKNTIDILDVLYYYTVVGNFDSCTKNYELFLDDRMKAIASVKNFLEQEGILSEYASALYARIIICKQAYLINKDCFDLHRYYSLYPEANKAWRKFNYGKRERLLFVLAEHKMSLLIRLFYWLFS